MDQLSDSYTKVSRSAINLKIAIIIRFCMADEPMADELNGHALPVHQTNPYKNYNCQNHDGTLRYIGLWLWKLVHFILNFVCSFQWCVLFMCLIKLWQSSCVDLRWVAKQWNTCLDLRTNLRFDQSQCKSPVGGQTKHKLNTSRKLVSTCGSVFFQGLSRASIRFTVNTFYKEQQWEAKPDV